MNFDDYKTELEYPTKDHITYVYDNGKVVAKCETSEEYQTYLTKWNTPDKFGRDMITERVYIDNDVYDQKLKEFNEDERRLYGKFKEDLYKEFGVENNPKRELLYSKAYDMGHSSGYSEIYHYFDELVDLIKEN